VTCACTKGKFAAAIEATGNTGEKEEVTFSWGCSPRYSLLKNRAIFISRVARPTVK